MPNPGKENKQKRSALKTNEWGKIINFSRYQGKASNSDLSAGLHITNCMPMKVQKNTF
jgi:hypothetical protein